MERMVCANLLRTPTNDSLIRTRFTRTKADRLSGGKSAKPIPKSHLNRYVDAFRTFIRITGVPCLNESDLGILDVEAKDWESIYQCPRKQAGEITIMVLKSWEEFVSDSMLGLTKRLFAWSFRVAVAACLRWDDLLCTAPTTLVLMKEGLIVFAARTKTRGKSEGRHWGDRDFAFSKKKSSREVSASPKKTQGVAPVISG